MTWKLTPAEPTDAMTDGLARQIIMWTRFEDPYGCHLHAHLRRSGTEIPAWLEDLIPDEMHVPPKAAVASAIYKAMIADAPDPLEDAELVERMTSAIERELDVEEAVLADPMTKRRLRAQRIMRRVITATKG